MAPDPAGFCALFIIAIHVLGTLCFQQHDSRPDCSDLDRPEVDLKISSLVYLKNHHLIHLGFPVFVVFKISFACCCSYLCWLPERDLPRSSCVGYGSLLDWFYVWFIQFKLDN